jgi:ABC-type histidine transport system ATPase subunit
LGLEQPQPLLEATHWLCLADVDLFVLRRDSQGGVAAVPDHQLVEIHPAVCILLADSGEMQHRHLLEQAVDCPLQVGTHASRKAPFGDRQ